TARFFPDTQPAARIRRCKSTSMQQRRQLALTPQHAGNAMAEQERVVWFDHLRMSDVHRVGGKNASLGEMISQLAGAGVRVPGGFATTAQAFREFLSYSIDGGLPLAQRIADRLATLNIADVRALAAARREIRQCIVDTPFQPRLQQELSEFYQNLVSDS